MDSGRQRREDARVLRICIGSPAACISRTRDIIHRRTPCGVRTATEGPFFLFFLPVLIGGRGSNFFFFFSSFFSPPGPPGGPPGAPGSPLAPCPILALSVSATVVRGCVLRFGLQGLTQRGRSLRPDRGTRCVHRDPFLQLGLSAGERRCQVLT